MVVDENDYLGTHRKEMAATLVDNRQTAAEKIVKDLMASIQ